MKTRKSESSFSFFPDRESKRQSRYPQRYVSTGNSSRMQADAKRDAVRHARRHPLHIGANETRLEAAERWLRDLLIEGPIYNHDAYLVASAAGVPPKLLERAKATLDIRYENHNNSARACWRLWFWCLPDELDED